MRISKGDTRKQPFVSTVIAVTFRIPVKDGGTATLVPLVPGITPRDLPVGQVHKSDSRGDWRTPDDDPKYDWRDLWSFSMETSDPELLELPSTPGMGLEFPFNALVVYPAHEDVVSLPFVSLVDFPSDDRRSARTFLGAVDLTGDKKPDVAVFQYCAEGQDEPPLPTGTSDCHIRHDYVYVRDNGPWRMAYFRYDH